MTKKVAVSEDFKEVTLTIKFPIDEMINTFYHMFYQKLNESNEKIMEVINDSDETLSRMAVCNLLGISQTTMTKRLKEGRIPYSKIGRKLIFSKKDVLAAIKIEGGKYD